MLLRDLIDEWGARPESLYPTHVERNEELMLEAIRLTQRGVTIDVDTVAGDLHNWLPFFDDHGGNRLFLTVSSDAAINAPRSLFEQCRSCVLNHGMDFGAVLPLITSNPARVLKLKSKGRLAVGLDADIVILAGDSLELAHVVAQGRHVFRDGRMNVKESFLKESNRRVELYGEKR
jgi:beta-aspartyl-dipeptidase (metallo-type)